MTLIEQEVDQPSEAYSNWKASVANVSLILRTRQRIEGNPSKL